MGIDFSGDDYPYNSLRLIINYFEKSNQINFYITDAGYYSSNTEVQLVFNNEKEPIFKPTDVKLFIDAETVFLGEFFSPNNIKR